LFIVTIGVLVYHARHPAIVVAPVTIPEALTQEGYEPKMLARSVVSALVDIDRQIKGAMATDRLTARFAQIDGMQERDAAIVDSTSLPDVKIKDSLSLQTIVAMLKSLRGAPDLTVDVAVVRRANGHSAQVTVAGGWVGPRKEAQTATFANIEALMKDAAKKVVWLSRPHALAGYEVLAEDQACTQRECDYTRPLELLTDLEKTATATTKPWVLIARSSVLMRQEKYQGCVRVLDPHLFNRGQGP
jgi:hypothetical protein